MSRSGYSDDYDDDNWSLIRWRGAVASAIRGKKGQAFLKELLAAFEAMPEKKLIANSFSEQGSYCTLGVIGASRGVEMPVVDLSDDEWVDPQEIRDAVSVALNIPDALAAEIMYYNDSYDQTPEQRWERMHRWIEKRISPDQDQPK